MIEFKFLVRNDIWRYLSNCLDVNRHWSNQILKNGETRSTRCTFIIGWEFTTLSLYSTFKNMSNQLLDCVRSVFAGGTHVICFSLIWRPAVHSLEHDVILLLDMWPSWPNMRDFGKTLLLFVCLSIKNLYMILSRCLTEVVFTIPTWVSTHSLCVENERYHVHSSIHSVSVKGISM